MKLFGTSLRCKTKFHDDGTRILQDCGEFYLDEDRSQDADSYANADQKETYNHYHLYLKASRLMWNPIIKVVELQHFVVGIHHWLPINKQTHETHDRSNGPNNKELKMIFLVMKVIIHIKAWEKKFT